jgi:glycosyltransferase involved in cell wall biosynthesis
MIKVHILFEHGPDFRPFGSASIRLLRPLMHPALQDRLEVTCGSHYLGEPKDIVIVDRLWRNDVTLEMVNKLVLDIRKADAKLVYALDDSFFDIPTEHNVQFPTEKIKASEFLLCQADCIWVTTQALKERFSEYNQNIIVLPHALDERLLVPRPPERVRSPWRKKRKIIGYMGTFTHDQDLMMVMPALKAVWQNHADEVEFQFIGCVANEATKQELAGLPVRYIYTEPGEEEYPLFMLWFTGQIDWDIAIAPLRDITFNRSKSEIKWLDYSAIGVPGIYSDIPAYHSSIRHLETGLLVENRGEAWIQALEGLLNDDSTRLRIAQNAYNELYSHRILARCNQRWFEAIEQVIPKVDPNQTKTATIVIPTKNAEPYIKETLEAIFSQETDVDFEVLVVDSGSKDRTLEILSAYPVRVIQVPPESFNHGLTRNLGTQEARPDSDFIVFLSQDAKPYDPHWLQNLIRPFFELPDVAGAFSRHIPRPGASASTVRQLIQLTQTGGKNRLVKKMPATQAEFEAQRFYYNFFSNTSSALRRKIWEKTPFQRVDFAEDALWADTVIQAGHTIVFEPESIVMHSHNYSLIEQFRQNVDHASGMERLFHPWFYHSRKIWLKQFVGLPLQICQDSHFVTKDLFFSNQSLWYKGYMMLFSIPWQFATVLGSWFGANLEKMPKWLKLTVSRQERLKSS